LREARKNNVLKPNVIFFGESLLPETKTKSFIDIERGDRLFLIGTTLATYSAFR
jgi:NAD+-dependent protein deacetylase sirtuin 4